MKRAIGYARLSKDLKGSVSVEYQVDAIHALAKAHDLTLVGIETDLVSGKSIKGRPGVQRLIDKVEKNEVDSVLVFKSDRLSRNGLESLNLEKLFASKKVSYFSSTEGTLIGDSVEDQFMAYVRAGLNEREKNICSMRRKASCAKRRELGQRLGSQPKYGEKIVNKELVQDETEMKLVLRVKALRSSGQTLKNIVASINSEGFTTRKGTSFSLTQVVRILKAA